MLIGEDAETIERELGEFAPIERGSDMKDAVARSFKYRFQNLCYVRVEHSSAESTLGDGCAGDGKVSVPADCQCHSCQAAS